MKCDVMHKRTRGEVPRGVTVIFFPSFTLHLLVVPNEDVFVDCQRVYRSCVMEAANDVRGVSRDTRDSRNLQKSF